MSRDQERDADTRTIRNRLLAERKLLLAKGSPAAVGNSSPDDRDSDEADAAISTDFREQALWLAEDYRQRLTLIEQALQRLDEGIYGRCETCGGAISQERLEALPLATQCIKCQQQAERQGRRVSRGRAIQDW